jgi:tetratricopeptide (TPR) repeat protein
MKTSLRFSGIVIFTFFANSISAQKLKLSTTSDSCLYYYYQGWREVMDNGDYTASEKSYRNMVRFDSDFLVGLSLLGRISLTKEERETIEATLQKRKSEIKGDERLLLDVFLELLTLTNLRGQDPEKVKVQRSRAFEVGEKNLRIITHRYPDDVYTKAEYFEVLHYQYGPKIAFDSLNVLSSTNQLQNPFILGFAAELEAELGNFDSALRMAGHLKTNLINLKVPKAYVVLADIYYKMGKKADAKAEVNQALKLDAGNIDAQRLKIKIDEMK